MFNSSCQMQSATSMAAMSSRMTRSFVSKVARFSLTSSSSASASSRQLQTRTTSGQLTRIACMFAACNQMLGQAAAVLSALGNDETVSVTACSLQSLPLVGTCC